MKRKFVYSPELKEMVEVSLDYEPGPRGNTDATLWNDRSYDGMRATDGADIGSRSKHREYMKANNLTTIDDFKGTFERARAQRDQYYTRGGTVTKEDVGRAIAQLERQRR